MKYLRKFNESKYEDNLKDDIRQIFSDLTDDKCDITISRIDTTNYILLSNKLFTYFNNEQVCREYLEQIRWNGKYNLSL